MEWTLRLLNIDLIYSNICTYLILWFTIHQHTYIFHHIASHPRVHKRKREKIQMFLLMSYQMLNVKGWLHSNLCKPRQLKFELLLIASSYSFLLSITSTFHSSIITSLIFPPLFRLHFLWFNLARTVCETLLTFSIWYSSIFIRIVGAWLWSAHQSILRWRAQTAADD